MRNIPKIKNVFFFFEKRGLQAPAAFLPTTASQICRESSWPAVWLVKPTPEEEPSGQMTPYHPCISTEAQAGEAPQHHMFWCPLPPPGSLLIHNEEHSKNQKCFFFFRKARSSSACGVPLANLIQKAGPELLMFDPKWRTP